MISKSGKPLCKMALVISPVNTLTNWKNEIQRWTGNLSKPLNVINLGDLVAGSRPMEISNWKGTGGVLLVGPEMFRALSDDLVKARPDILVLDEAHKMLNNAATIIFKKLIGFKTKRRICLSGTPIQNNTIEYYHFAEFMRPGVIGVKGVEDFKERYE
jgi:transcriptional regulator ATRX